METFIAVLIIVISIWCLLMTVMFVKIFNGLTEVKNSMQDKYIHFSPEVEDVVDLAISYWAIKKEFDKCEESSGMNVRRTQHYLRQLEKFLSAHNVEIQDDTGRAYNEGLNIKPTFDKSEDVKKPYIKDVISPAIFIDGKLYKKEEAIVAVAKKNGEQDEQ